ncbi:ATPase AAA-type core domain-containing protein [Tumidithrix helvetica PCC 7403]|uniref:AAA family ATPase n=1 Tax=Tumidithrix helvetica TaxID=3457545 RepID=UPI003C96EA3A
MLSKLRVQHYKSLFDTTVDLEPLTVFIGPNGSGKSNICEALAVLSNFLQQLIHRGINTDNTKDFFAESLRFISQNPQSLEAKFWQGKLDDIFFEVSTSLKITTASSINILLTLGLRFIYSQEKVAMKIPLGITNQSTGFEQKSISALREALVDHEYPESELAYDLRRVKIYDFAPTSLSNIVHSPDEMNRSGQGIAYTLLDILLDNRESFDELEDRLVKLVPNIKRISLQRGSTQNVSLELIDKYSEHHIPASDISDGTLRILAFLTALYQKSTPSIICFEEIENGVHPWLLHKMMELLKIVSTEGINGKPVQVLITTHSPVLLNYVEPYQVRAVELDDEGKTQVHALPTDSMRFQKALEAYDGSLGELWFTNVFGGNPA